MKTLLLILGTICFISPLSWAQNSDDTPAEQVQEQQAETQEFNQNLDQFEQDIQKKHPAAVASAAEPAKPHHTKVAAKSEKKKKPVKKKAAKKTPAKKSKKSAAKKSKKKKKPST